MNEKEKVKDKKYTKIIVIVLALAITVLIILMNVIVVDKVTGKTIMQTIIESFSSSNTNNIDPQCGTRNEPSKLK